MSERTSFLAVAYGGGVNSTAMLCGMKERGIKPDFITFADTGGETPETYEHVKEMGAICREWWNVDIEWVHKTFHGGFEGLEGNCLRQKMLPSLAYGRKGCSQKYKVQPQIKALLKEMDRRSVKECTKAIGYDASESHRRINTAEQLHCKGRLEKFWYPLIEWQWRRQECVEAIKRHGITVPPKSACFFCPAMKRGEILRLKEEHPELFERALQIEANAVTTKNMGLTGRALRWADIANQDDAQGKLWEFLDQNDATDTPCGCFDG